MDIFRFKYRYCKSRMVAFINGELPHASRQRIARYIDECPDCYVEYQRHRNLQRELKERLPAFGQPDSVQLGRIWTVIQDEMRGPRPKTRVHYHARYGLVTLALILALCLPLMLGGGHVTQAAATQPSPPQSVAAGATERATIIGPVAVATQVTNTSTGTVMVIEPEAAPQRTPNSAE